MWILHLTILFFSCVGLSAGRHKSADVASHDKHVVCYWASWAKYRAGNGSFDITDIDPSLCTNLIYTFVGMDHKTSLVKHLDPWLELGDNGGFGFLEKVLSLKESNPDLKISAGLGGFSEGSVKYSLMANDEVKRNIFVESVVQFLTKFQLDGLDFNWVFPGNNGGAVHDKENYIILLSQLKTAMEPHNLLLTGSVGRDRAIMDAAYDVPGMYRYLDYVHVTTYDYHTKIDRQTGHNSPLFGLEGKDVNATWEYLLERGAIPEKTIIGIPSYGRTFHLENAQNNAVGAISNSKEKYIGKFTATDGFLSYYEICSLLKKPGNHWTTHWDETQKVPYMTNDATWISYDNEKSVQAKTNFAMSRKMAGVLIWSLDTDDFKGLCGSQKFPLLKSIISAITDYFKPATGLNPVCSTTAGDECLFPFVYDGVTYTECTTVGQLKPWCVTKIDGWGDCADSCFESNDQFKQTTCTTTDNKYCQFPFINGGRVHYSCAPRNKVHPSGPWCATAVDENLRLLSSQDTGSCSANCKGVNWFTSTASESRWAFQCEFVGNDMNSLQTKPEDCLTECQTEPECTHFNWVPKNRGTCFLKMGAVQLSQAAVKNSPAVRCGVIAKAVEATQVNWDNYVAHSCNIEGGDVVNEPGLADDCFGICFALKGCSHFVWTSENGGTCWLKEGHVKKSDFTSVDDPTQVCGIVEFDEDEQTDDPRNGADITRRSA